MNKKKCKLDYNPELINRTLKKLLLDENIIGSQKCYIYSKFKTYKDLYNKLQIEYKDLEIENINLYEKLSNKSILLENIGNQNSPSDIEDSFNETENIKNKLNEYSKKIKYDTEDENQTLLNKITNLRNSLKEKENKIVELENTVIKLQIISRNNNHIRQDNDDNSDELINLKTRVEYSKLEKERLIVNSNNKIMEIKVKLDEFMKKYDKINENYNNSLLTIEELKSTVKENDMKKLDQISEVKDKLKNIYSEIDRFIFQINSLHEIYLDMKNQDSLIIKLNKDILNKLNCYKIFENKKNEKKGEDYYEEEITNLLEVCDSLIEENKKYIRTIRQLEQKILDLDNENRKLKNEKESVLINSTSNNLLKYIEDLAYHKKIISNHISTIKTLTDEKNKLIRLNVERIKHIEKYKDELKNKNIEMLCLEKKNEDIETTFREFEKVLYEKLSRKSIKENEQSILICNLCDTNNKNVAIISCMHTFCEECIKLRIKLRDRKCPTCGYSFNVNDVKRLYL